MNAIADTRLTSAPTRLFRVPSLTLNRRIKWVLLITILLMATAVRFYSIGKESYWLDEIIMVRITSGSFDDVMLHLQENSRPPVYVLVSYAWTQLFGTDEAATRALSAVTGVLSVGVLVVIGRALFGLRVGLLAGMVMSISAFQVRYAQEHRYYSVLQLVILLAALAYILFMQRRKLIYLVMFVASCILATYVHTYAVFFIAALGVHFLLRILSHASAKVRVSWVLSQVLILIGILPQVLENLPGLTPSGAAAEEPLGGGTGVTEWLSTPPLYAPIRALMRFLIIKYDYLEMIFLVAATVVFVVVMIAFVRRIGWEKWSTRLHEVFGAAAHDIRHLDDRFLLILCWLIVPIALPFALSLVVSPLYLERFLIPAASAWYLLIGVIMHGVHKIIPRWISGPVLAIIIAGSLYNYYNDTIKEQWREAAAHVEMNALDGDRIAISYSELPGDAFNVSDSFYWYFPERQEDCFVDMRTETADIAQQIRQCARKNNRVWLVLYSPQPFDDVDYIQAFPDLSAENIDLLDRQRFFGVTTLLFEVRPLRNSNPQTRTTPPWLIAPISPYV